MLTDAQERKFRGWIEEKHALLMDNHAVYLAETKRSGGSGNLAEALRKDAAAHSTLARADTLTGAIHTLDALTAMERRRDG